MGRKKLIDAPIEKSIHLPQSLVEEVEELIWYPVRGKVRYGAFSTLVTDLLRGWVAHRKGKPAPQPKGEET